MKILLVNKFWYLRGGTERVVFSTKELLEKAGHTVEVFGMHHPDNIISNNFFVQHVDYETVRGWRKISAGFQSLYHQEARQKLRDLIDSFQPDVIHLHNFFHELSLSVFSVIRESGIPTVMTLHDYQMLSPNYFLFHHGKIDESCVSGKYYRCIFNNCMEDIPKSILATFEAYLVKWKKYRNCIAHFIAPSTFMREKCIEAGWDGKIISVLQNPIRAIARIGFSTIKTSSIPSALYVGRFSEEKGLDVFLDAATYTPEIPYLCVGDGPMRSHIEERIVKEQIKNVSLLGWQKDKEIETLLQTSQLVVVPSLWHENCPMSILEAKAAGTPVVASRIGGIPEFLDGRFLAEPGNAGYLAKKVTFWYTASSEERERVGVEFRDQVSKRHNPQKYVASLLEMYGRLQE